MGNVDSGQAVYLAADAEHHDAFRKVQLRQPVVVGVKPLKRLAPADIERGQIIVRGCQAVEREAPVEFDFLKTVVRAVNVFKQRAVGDIDFTDLVLGAAERYECLAPGEVDFPLHPAVAEIERQQPVLIPDLGAPLAQRLVGTPVRVETALLSVDIIVEPHQVFADLGLRGELNVDRLLRDDYLGRGAPGGYFQCRGARLPGRVGKSDIAELRLAGGTGAVANLAVEVLRGIRLCHGPVGVRGERYLHRAPFRPGGQLRGGDNDAVRLLRLRFILTLFRTSGRGKQKRQHI